jgi:hypothetical protein
MSKDWEITEILRSVSSGEKTVAVGATDRPLRGLSIINNEPLKENHNIASERHTPSRYLSPRSASPKGFVITVSPFRDNVDTVGSR